MNPLIGLLLTLNLVQPVRPADAADAALTAQLRANDQLLLNANYAAWAKFTAPDFVYVDEESQVTGRAAFLKELDPKATGRDDALQISTYAVQRAGNTAVVVFRADEKGNYLGSKLDDQYLFTETWQRLDGAWKLRILHVNAVRTAPPAVALTPAQLDELTGTYRADSATYTLRRDGDRLIGQRAGRPAKELLAETRDVLFAPGNTRARKVFQRDAQGLVTSFVDRNENRDIVWVRIK